MTMTLDAPAVEPPSGPTPRSGCVRALVIAAGVAVLGVVVLVAGIVVVARRLDRPATVPPDFRPPTTLPVAAPSAAVPVGDLAFDSDRSGNFELYLMGPDGTGVRPLTHDPTVDSWWPRISPDRRTIVFYRTPAGTNDRDFTATALWAVGADGQGLTLLRPAGADDWTQQGHAEWSPDGTQLVMFGGSRFNPQIFVTDATGRHPRAVTDRPGTNIDPSFTPDGGSVVFVSCPDAVCTGGTQEIYRIGVDGHDLRRLTTDDLRDQDPYVSPDGTQVAWLTQVAGGLVGVWDVRIADADGAGVRRLARDDGVTSRPQWSADGRTIYVHRIAPGASTFSIVAFRTDGSGSVDLTAGQPGSNEYPST